MLVNKSKKIGICSPSWSGPGEYPHVFEYGIEKLKQITGMEVIISQHATSKGFVSFEDRARDINSLFADEEVGLICASIGGEDSVNILPFLDLELIHNNPKPIMGFSDTTTLLLYLKINCNTPAIYGPSIMSGFSEPSGINQDFINHIQDILFTDIQNYNYKNYSTYIDGYNEWEDKEKFLDSNPEIKNYKGWDILNPGKVDGELYGGCLEVIKMVKDNGYFPDSENFWKDKILFLETSEQAPGVDYIISEIKDYHKRGVLKNIKALLFGQFTYYSNEDVKKINYEIKKLVVDNLGYKNLPIITNLNFGHVRPQWLLLIGSKVQVDTVSEKLTILK